MPADLNACLNPDPGGPHAGQASAALMTGTLFTTFTLCNH